MFQLHPQLEKDCLLIKDLVLCKLLLLNDANYPWFILVPMRENIREIYELNDDDQQQLLRESNALSRIIMQVYGADKLNVAALGNVVPQLHIHHIARYTLDPVWPAPVWGKLDAVPYTEGAAAKRILQCADSIAAFLN